MRGPAHCYRLKIIDGEKFLMIAATIFILVIVLIFGQGMSQIVSKGMDVKWLEVMFCQTVPLAQSHINPQIKFDFSPSKVVLGFDINEPLTIITSQIAVVTAAGKTEDKEVNSVAEVPSSTPGPQKAKKIAEVTISSSSSKSNNSSCGVNVKNNTTYQIDVEKLMNEKLKFNIDKGSPQVLIVHTHASESFTPSDKNYYLPTDPDRTEDKNFNIVRVGDEMAKTLNKLGIETLHDTTLHDYPSYNGSYNNCLATVQKYLKENPSIKVVLDIHRDGMVTSDGTKLKVCTTVEGKKTAQVMIICGTDNNGLYHPNWRENFKLALRMQSKMNELYPTLARPISLVKERYNMHTTNGSLLIEVGSNGNTLEEAINGGYYTAVSIGNVLKSLQK